MVVLGDIVNQKGLKIFHLNIRSLIPKIEQLRLILEDRKIDIFSISESWLHAGVCSSIVSIPGYDLVRQDRETMINEHAVKRGGGLCVYYNTEMSCNSESWSRFNVSNCDLELQILQFNRKNARNLILMNVYRPPNGDVGKAIDSINEAILNIRQLSRKDLVVMGDFNIDFANKRHKNVKALSYFASLNGLTQLITEPTRYTPVAHTTIDLIFSNIEYIQNSGTLDLFISDHQPIFLLKKKSKVRHTKVELTGRTYRNYSGPEACNRLDQILDKNLIKNENDPSVCWDYLLNDITTLADELTPKKVYKIRKDKPIWLTNDLLNMQKDREYLYKKAKKTRKHDDWLVACAHRNRVNKAIREAKADFIKDELTRNKSNPKKFWRSIKNDIIPDKKSHILNLVDPETNRQYEIDEIPSIINQFFAEVGPKLASSLPEVDIDNFAINLDDRVGEPGFEIVRINSQVVIKYVKELSVYKSSGIRDLGSVLLKDIFLYIPDVLADIYNKVIATNIFPDSWKIATVVPLPKINNPKSPSELRPISLLPIVGKIMEKIIHSQLKDYLEIENLLVSQQHGFRKNHSTQSACAKFIDDIMLYLDKGYSTVAVFLDVKKAFDTINHQVLLKKLQNLNVGQNALALIENYLTNRKQCVVYQNQCSDELSLTTGVPQGSTLGPLLFLIYINDLPNILNNCDCLLFADDTVIYNGKTDTNIAYTAVQSDLDEVYSWCNKNQITLNQAKTEYIHFSYRKRTDLPGITLKLCNKPISKTNSYKYLGTDIDTKLNCIAQYNNLIKKLSTRKITFSKIRYLLTTDAAVALYRSCIQPLFDYNDFYYLLLSQKYCKKLQAMQYRFLKIVFKGLNYSNDQMLAKVGVEKLDLRRKVHVAGLMYKRSTNPEYLDSRDLPTRQFNKRVLKIPEVNLTKTFKSPIYFGSTLWNALPRHIQDSETYQLFKYRYKQLLLNL